MRIVHIETLLSRGEYPNSRTWKRARRQIRNAIACVDWPEGSGKFTIYPESGKKSGKGNGVTPIKKRFISELCGQKWVSELCLGKDTERNPGGFDVVLGRPPKAIAVEWETGNISSSHRALNKMALGLRNNLLRGAVLVVPSKKLAQYLTDRIGNYPELEPYLKLWKEVRCSNGVLEIMVIEQDGESLRVPRIKKGTDGRSAR